ncbi:aminotransferase [Anopheles sinensis]|uniref:Aminotransferase n=1 Tax=Anopheles sinensis TaxID=74873 RepID=A0A084W2K3_ANOSI|nr:aminotransferase [Anopheles sinensis]
MFSHRMSTIHLTFHELAPPDDAERFVLTAADNPTVWQVVMVKGEGTDDEKCVFPTRRIGCVAVRCCAESAQNPTRERTLDPSSTNFASCSRAAPCHTMRPHQHPSLSLSHTRRCFVNERKNGV